MTLLKTLPKIFLISLLTCAGQLQIAGGVSLA